MSWLQAQLIVKQTEAQLIEALFENLGALSTTLVDAEDEPLLEPALGEMPIWKKTKVIGLFSAEIPLDQLRSQINQALNADVTRDLTISPLKDEAWERVWLKYFKPMQFGQRLWICPTGHQVKEDNAIIIDLDPGLAFGTGTHPTTALCLTWLEQADLNGKIIIDYGCGSGILAIAALKLGAEKVIAIDNDPQALLATQANAEKNKVIDKIEIFNSSEKQEIKADIVIANILSGILVELTSTLSKIIKKEGEIVLSGILKEQQQMIEKAYSPIFQLNSPQKQEDWLLISGSNVNAHPLP